MADNTKKVNPALAPLSWTKNLAKSFGYAIGDKIADSNPVIKNLVSDTKKISEELFTKVKDFKSPDNEIVKFGKETFSNTLKNSLDDLKSGNLYNKQRMDAAENEMMSAVMGMDMSEMGFDMSDLEDWGDDFNDEASAELAGDEAIISNDNLNTARTINAMDAVGGKVAGTISTVTAESANYIVQSNNKSSKILFDLNQKGFATVTESIMAVNNSIVSLAKIGQPLTDHINNSATFYTKTTEMMSQMNQYLGQIAENTKPLPTSSGSPGEVKGTFSSIFGDDILSGLVNMVKENLGEEIGGLFDDFKDLIGKGGLKNISLPAFAIQKVTDLVFTKNLENVMKEFNESLKDSLGAGLLKLKGKSTDIGGLWGSMFLDMLFPKDGFKDYKEYDTSKYEKGPIQFDGITKKAITEVIPISLMKIYSAITGEDEMRYDYNRGKFVKYGKIKQDIRNEKSEFYASEYAQKTKEATNDYLSELTSDPKVQAAFEEQISSFFRRAFEDSADSLDFDEITNNKDFYKDYKGKGKNGEEVALSKEVQDALVYALKDRGTYANFIVNRQQSRDNYGDLIRAEEAKGSSLYNYVNDGWAEEAKKNKPKGGRFFDEFGNNSLFYLRGIYELLGGDPKAVIKPSNAIYLPNGSIANSAEKVTQRAKTTKDANASNISSSSGSEDPYMSEATIERLKKEGKITEDSKLIAKKINDDKEEWEDNVRSKFESTKIGSILTAPANAVAGLISSINGSIQQLFWGDDYNNPDDKKSLFGVLITKAGNGLDKLFEKLFDGKTFKEKLDEWTDKIFGKKGEDGNRTGGVLSDFFNDTKENLKGAWQWLKSPFTSEAEEESGQGSGLFYISGGGRGRRRRKKRNAKKKKLSQQLMEEAGNALKNKVNEKVDDAKGDISEKVTETIENTKSKIKDGFDNFANSKVGKPVIDNLKAAGEYTKDSIFSFVDAIIGDPKKTDEEKKQIKENISKASKGIFKEMGRNKGAMGAGAIIGAGTSILTGAVVGPLAGAAIGAAAGLIIKSDFMQDMLFGKQDENGERNGGLFSKELTNFIKKEVPNIGRGAAIGAAGGLFMGSPFIGAIVGGGLGFVASSENAKKWLFGEIDKETGERKGGIIPKDVQKRIKEALPAMTAGAIGGLAIGPFGLAGNLVFGAALGYATTSENFRKFLFGDENGEYKTKGLFGKEKSKKALLPRIREIVIGPLDDLMHNGVKRIRGFLERVGRRASKMIYATIKHFGENAKQGKGIFRLFKPLYSGIGKLTKGMLGFGTFITEKVFGGISKGTKRANLRMGYGVYGNKLDANGNEIVDERGRKVKGDLTARERLLLRERIGTGHKRDRSKGFDKFLADFAGDNDKTDDAKIEELGEIQNALVAYNKVGATDEDKQRAMDVLKKHKIGNNGNLGKLIKKNKSRATDFSKLINTEIEALKGEKKDAKETLLDKLINLQVDSNKNQEEIKEKQEKNNETQEEHKSITETIKESVTGIPGKLESIGSYLESIANKIGAEVNIIDNGIPVSSNSISSTAQSGTNNNIIDNGIPVSNNSLSSTVQHATNAIHNVGELLGGNNNSDNNDEIIIDGSGSGLIPLSLISGGSPLAILGSIAGTVGRGILTGAKAVGGVAKTIGGAALKGAKAVGGFLGKGIKGVGKGISKATQSLLQKRSSPKLIESVKNKIGKSDNLKSSDKGSEKGDTESQYNPITGLFEKFKRGRDGSKVPDKSDPATKQSRSIGSVFQGAISSVQEGFQNTVASMQDMIGKMFGGKEKKEPTLFDRLKMIGFLLLPKFLGSGSFLGDLLNNVKDILPFITEKVGPFITDTVFPLLQNIGGTVFKVLEEVIPIGTNLIESLKPAVTTIVTTVGDLFVSLSPLIGTIIDTLTPTITAISEVLKPIAETVSAISTVVQPIYKFMAPIAKALSPLYWIGEGVKALTDMVELLIPDNKKKLQEQRQSVDKLMNSYRDTGERVKGEDLTKYVDSLKNGGGFLNENGNVYTNEEIAQKLNAAYAGGSITAAQVKGALDRIGAKEGDEAYKAITSKDLKDKIVNIKGDINDTTSGYSSINFDGFKKLDNEGLHEHGYITDKEYLDNIQKSADASATNGTSKVAGASGSGSGLIGTLLTPAKSIFNSANNISSFNVNNNNNPIDLIRYVVGTFKDLIYGDKSKSLKVTVTDLNINPDNKSIVTFLTKNANFISALMKGNITFAKADINKLKIEENGKTSTSITNPLDQQMNQIMDKYGADKVSDAVVKLINSGMPADKAKEYVIKNVENLDSIIAGNTGSGSRLRRLRYISGGSSGFVSQTSSDYDNISYAGSSFAEKGCAPSVASMAANAAGKNLSVSNAISASNGYQNQYGTSIDYFDNALGKVGVDTSPVSTDGALESLSRGNSVIMLGRDPSNTSKANSPFGPNGHYVLATGMDSDGNITVNDPEMSGPTSYPAGNLLRGMSMGEVVSGGGSKKKKGKKKGSGTKEIINMDIVTELPRLNIASIKKIIKKRIKGKNSIVKTSDAKAIYEAQEASGISALALMGIATKESGLGTSSIAKRKFNLWGWNATNANPSGNAKQWDSVGAAFKGYGYDLKRLYYNKRKQRTINEIGGYDAKGKKMAYGYAYTNNGYSTTWAPEISDIIKGYIGYGLKDSSGNAIDNNYIASNSDPGNLSGSVEAVTFPTYDLSDKQIQKIANVLQYENGTKGPGAKNETSMAANYVDIDGKKHDATYATNMITAEDGKTHFFGGKRARERANGKKAPKSMFNIVKDIFVNGHRTLPRYVNEHDGPFGSKQYANEIEWIDNGDGKITKFDEKYNKSKYKQYKTKIHNKYGSTYTFYDWAGGPNSNNGDPFGYTSEKKRKQFGDGHFDMNGKPIGNITAGSSNSGSTVGDSSSSSGNEQQTVQSEDYLGTITSVFSDALSKVFGKQETQTTSTTSDTTSSSGEDIIPSSDGTWLSSVHTVKKKMANKNISYNQSGSVKMKLGKSNKERTVRTDCSGLVSAMLVDFTDKDFLTNSSGFTGNSKFLTKAGFKKMGWKGWDKLVDGDIIAKKGHVEVSAGKPYKVYNGGSTKSLQNPGVTNTGHKDGYQTVWRYVGKDKSGKGSGLLDIINSPNFIEYTSGSGTDSNELKQRISTKKMAEKIIKFTGNGNNEAAVKLIYNKIFTNEDPSGLKALTGNKTKSEKEYMKLYKKMVEYIGNMDAKLDNLEKTVNIESQLLALFKDFATKLLAMKTAEIESGESSSELDPEFENLMNTLVNLAK